ncbi:cell surface A33 antigen-like [Pelmatolapia mariae]|uniref:cell surface A33 antigen-like n=1 Tax=Pelmatolapia mariae TaxID=158779 RepID=UPI002FE5A514
MEERISALMLLCLVLSSVSAIDVTIPQSQYEYSRGDNITLPCSFTTTTPINSQKLVIITWSVFNPDRHLLSWPFPSTDIDTDYEGRVSLDLDLTQGKANLKLSSISLADNKDFECCVHTLGDKKGKISATTRLVVLAAPSKPICKIQGIAEYHQNISLICVSEEGSPPPTYSWERHDVKNNPVPHHPSTTDKGGILSLYDISIWTSGPYICTSENKIHAATCNITLSVMPPK